MESMEDTTMDANVIERVLELGFFLQPDDVFFPGNYLANFSQNPVPRFIYTTEEGKALKEGRWGNLDEYLSFLGQRQIEIIGSSKGLLLCRTDRQSNMDYIICNPVTREFRALPKPHKPYLCACVAFMCSVDATFLNDVHFEVVRAALINPRQISTNVEIETFSSITNEWTEATLVSDSPILLVDGFMPPFTIDGVIFWLVFHYSNSHCHSALLAYDRGAASLGAKLIEAPPQQDGQRVSNSHTRFGPSEGKVRYARNYNDNLEIWVLEDYMRADWVMKYQVSLTVPEFVRVGLEFDSKNQKSFVPDVQSFHLRNSKLIFMTLRDKTFWYDIESKQKIGFPSYSTRHIRPYFLYEWPVPPTDD